MAKANKETKKATEQATAKSTAPKKEGSWFSTGEEGAKKKTQLDKMAEMKREKMVSRFFLKPGEEATIVFVDSQGFYILEHSLKVNGRWGNFATCVKEFDTCPICATGKNPTYTAYYTVIDTREFIRKSDGAKVKNRKVLFPAKGSVILQLNDYKKRYGSLAGMSFDVKRYTTEDPNCGNQFDKRGRVNIEQKLGKEAAIPYDYMKVLAPPTQEELISLGIIGESGVVTGAEGVAPSDDTLDDILG